MKLIMIQKKRGEHSCRMLFFFIFHLHYNPSIVLVQVSTQEGPSQCNCRVPTRQGKVREICFFFNVREKSGNSVKWSGKLENLQKSGKSQGILDSFLVNPLKIEK